MFDMNMVSPESQHCTQTKSDASKPFQVPLDKMAFGN